MFARVVSSHFLSLELHLLVVNRLIARCQIKGTKVNPGRSATNVRARFRNTRVYVHRMKKKKKETLSNYVYSTCATQAGVAAIPHSLYICTLLNGPNLPSPSFFLSSAQVLLHKYICTSLRELFFFFYHLAIWTGQHGTGWNCVQLHLRRVEHLTLFLFFLCMCFWIVDFFTCRGNSEKSRVGGEEVSTSTCGEQRRAARAIFSKINNRCTARPFTQYAACREVHLRV